MLVCWCFVGFMSFKNCCHHFHLVFFACLKATNVPTSRVEFLMHTYNGSFNQSSFPRKSHRKKNMVLPPLYVVCCLCMLAQNLTICSVVLNHFPEIFRENGFTKKNINLSFSRNFSWNWFHGKKIDTTFFPSSINAEMSADICTKISQAEHFLLILPKCAI